MSLENVLGQLHNHQQIASHAFNFTPSENTMSPLCRLPLVLDIYSRYFFEHEKLFGEWFFYGGVEAGTLQGNFSEQLLKELSGATFVDLKPLSGLQCMTIVMSALCPPSGTMLIVPEPWGGHMSTPKVAERLGINTVEIPMSDFAVDMEQLEKIILEHIPDLIYFDQSTQLFPLDPKPIRAMLDRHGMDTLIHYDSSHTNGLILGKSLFNPLEHGADSFGGSTHKTLPGPHKAFFCTNNNSVYDKYYEVAYHLISHCQVASSISLGLTLLELRDCGGNEYAQNTIYHAKQLAKALNASEVKVAAEKLGFTGCHQVWATTNRSVAAGEIARRMNAVGLKVNVLPGLPTLDKQSFRLSTAEITKLGANSADIEAFASIFSELINSEVMSEKSLVGIHTQVKELRNNLDKPKYCYTAEQIASMGVPDKIVDLVCLIEKTNSIDY
tara:strand:+ start:1856 stop:3178 length:1323 start_codon:yes stop_codon:yes gene_type:complete